MDRKYFLFNKTIARFASLAILPLLFAACTTSVEDAERLLTYHPDLEPRFDKEGRKVVVIGLPSWSRDYEENTSEKELRKKLEAFALLRKAGKMNINSTDAYRETALSKAIRLNDTDAVRDLLNQGADPNNCPVSYGNPGIYMAAEHRNLAMLKLLEEHGTQTKYGLEGYPVFAFFAACRTPDNKEVVEYLISKGADVNEQEFDDSGPPIFSATKDNKLILLKHGANINARYQSTKENALDYELGYDPDYRDTERIKFLLEHGIKTNNRCGEYSATSLMRAAQTGDPEIVALVLKYGGNPRLKDKNGKTAIDYIPEDSPNAQELREMLKKSTKR